jgi:hypothetical protein
MDNWNGIFLNGSGYIQEEIPENRKLSKHLDKLAQSEKDFIPEEFEPAKIECGSKEHRGLVRAGLSDEDSREFSNTNKVNKLAIDEAQSNEKIQQKFESMLSQGQDLNAIGETLSKDFPTEKVKNFIESNKDSFLNKFGQLGFIYLKKDTYNTCEDIKTALKKRIANGHRNISKLEVKDSSCANCTMYKRGFCLLTNLAVVKDPQVSSKREAEIVLNKFAKANFINASILEKYVEKLASESPSHVISSFVQDFKQNKDLSRRNDEEKKVGFKRDNDEKVMRERDIDNNIERQAKIKDKIAFGNMFNEFKTSILSGASKNEAYKKLANSFSVSKVLEFQDTFANDIDRLMKFTKREAFDTNFAGVKNKMETVDHNNFDKESSYDEQKILKHAFLMMMAGYDLENIKEHLIKNFGNSGRKAFKENQSKLARHFGQLGHIFIDSNVFDTCDDMMKNYENITDHRKKLIFSMKSNSKCAGCTFNQKGVCGKVGLMISSHPLVRSSRATKRVLKRASTFVPKSYIETFENQIKNDGNMELVSKFALGIKEALNVQQKGKVAAKDRTIDNTIQDILGNVNTFNVDLFRQSSESKVIDKSIE